MSEASILEKKNPLQKIMAFVNKAGTAMMINLLFLVSCLPVVTMGAAWSALYSAIRYSIRGDSWFQGFKAGYKCHFWRNLIGWTFGLAVMVYFFLNVNAGVEYIVVGNPVTVGGTVIPLIMESLFLLAALLITAAMLPVGLYFDSDASTWMGNTMELIRSAPLQVLGCAVLMWAPVLLFWYVPDIFILVALVFIAIYFILAGLIMTVLLKKPLIRILKRIRAENGEPEPEPGERAHETEI